MESRMEYYESMEYWGPSDWLTYVEERCGIGKGSRRNKKKKIKELLNSYNAMGGSQALMVIGDYIMRKNSDFVIIDDVVGVHSHSYGVPYKTDIPYNWLGDCKPASVGASPSFKHSITNLKPKQETNMGYASATTVAVDVNAAVTAAEKDKVNYLLRQLERAFDTKFEKFEKDFNIHVSTAPKTFAELIAKIKEGKYTIDSKVEKKLAAKSADADTDDEFYWGYGPMYGIVWQAEKMPDQKGFDAAYAALKAERTKAARTITVMSPAEGLAALEAFEAWVPTTETVH